MSKVVSITKTPAFMTSREFASRTHRQHVNVTNLIRRMVRRGELEITESRYLNQLGVSHPEFRLTLAHFEKMASKLNDNDMRMVRKYFNVQAPVLKPTAIAIAVAQPSVLTDPTVAQMTSQEIARLVNSRHDNVKITVDRLVGRGVIHSPALQEKSNSQGRPGMEYVFTGPSGKRDSIIVVAQLSPEFTARLVDRWQELEDQLAKPAFQVPTSFAAALMLAAQLEAERTVLVEQVGALEHKAAVDAPKVQFHDNVADASNCLTIGEFAKVINAGQKKLFKWLRDAGILMDGNLPFQKHLDAEHFRVIEKETTKPNGEIKVYTQTVVTGKGQTYIQKRITKAGPDLDESMAA